MWRNENDLSALLLCHPERVAGLHAAGFGGVVLGEDDAVSRLSVASNGDWLSTDGRMIQHLDGGVEVVHIAEEDCAFHSCSLKNRYSQNKCATKPSDCLPVICV